MTSPTASRRDPAPAERQADAVHDWLLRARRFWLGFGRFLLEMARQGWRLLVVLGVVAGLTLLSVGRAVPWTPSGVLAVLVFLLLLALIAGARLEVTLRGDLPITVRLDPVAGDVAGGGYFLLVYNKLGVAAPFSARVRSDPLPPGVGRDWTGQWQEDQLAPVINISARHEGVLDFVGGEMSVVAPATDEHPRLMHGAIWFPRSGPGQHALNYPPRTTDTYETALKDEDVAAVSVMAYVTIKRVEPDHTTTYAFRIKFVRAEATDQRPTLAYAIDVQPVT